MLSFVTPLHELVKSANGGRWFIVKVLVTSQIQIQIPYLSTRVSQETMQCVIQPVSNLISLISATLFTLKTRAVLHYRNSNISKFAGFN